MRAATPKISFCLTQEGGGTGSDLRNPLESMDISNEAWRAEDSRDPTNRAWAALLTCLEEERRELRELMGHFHLK